MDSSPAPPDALLDPEDNPLPAWWLGIFWLTIAFTLVYIPWLYATTWSQAKQGDEGVAAAEARWQAGAAAAAPPGDAARGRAVYAEKCFSCHGVDARGGIGPDLTDPVWVHGGTLDDIRRTVAVGVLEKGMLAWEPLIGASGVADVSAYVHGLGGGR